MDKDLNEEIKRKLIVIIVIFFILLMLVLLLVLSLVRYIKKINKDRVMKYTEEYIEQYPFELVFGGLDNLVLVDENDDSYFDNDDSFSIIRDKETGVNYIVFKGYRKAGICPRFNADGTLYVK